MPISDIHKLKEAVDQAVASAKITDIHTHLYSGDFGDILLWGIDELLTYHYLIAETMRWSDIPYSTFWSMSKQEQADLVWKTLFIENSPYSEACRGVLTVLDKLGLNVASRDLEEYRSYFNSLSVEQYIDIVFNLSGVESVVMTNDPFDDSERATWLNSTNSDPRFKSSLRIDPLLCAWDKSYKKLKEWGYDVCEELNEKTIDEIKRFLSQWIDKIKALYLAVSLTPDFRMDDGSPCAIIIEKCIVPVCREKNIPFAMMIGVKRLINPDLQLAGDGVGKGDMSPVEYLCTTYPQNKFMVTMLSRENQHELFVAARKYRNLMVFGCWWFLNNPVLIEEMTRMRFELLGQSFIPQHSDCRVLDQLLYKWDHSKKIISKVLFEKYCDIMETGWIIHEDEIKRDVGKLLGDNFYQFLDRSIEY